MAFQKFGEYLNSKGANIEKPIISVDGDTGPDPKKGDKPQKAATKGKGWNTEAAQVKDGGDPKPYSAPGTDPGLETADGAAGKADPLGKKGDQSLVYNPKTEDQTLKTNVKTKTESFLADTRELNAEKYAEYILRQNDGKSLKQILETVNCLNGPMMEMLVREIKRKGDLGKLVESVLNQPETYSEIAINLANESKGKEISRQLARAINEITAEPADDEIPSKPRKAKTVKDVPVEADNVLMSKGKMLRPEHHLIEALSQHKAIKATMKKLVD